MSIAQALPQVLEHVDLTKWERPSELLRLIATLQEGPSPVPIGRKFLEALGRTRREARYDHEVLVRLADRDRVLLRWRGEGRRPDSWAVAPLDRWRHVPWITPRRDVLAAFFSPLPDAAVALWTKRAAQAVALRTDTPLLEALQAAGLSVNLRSTTARHRSTTPQDAGETPLGSVHNATESGDSLHASRNLKIPSFLNERTKEDAELSQAAKAVIAAACDSHPDLRSIYGEPRQRIAQIVDDQPQQLARFLAAARSSSRGPWGVVRAIEAVAQLPTAVPAGPGYERPDCATCEGSGWIEQPNGTYARCTHTHPGVPADR